MRSFWIGVASLDHVKAGVEGGFAQLGHGKHIAVKSLKKGDWIVYYSPKTEMGKGAPVQSFTSIGKVTSEAPYQYNQESGFRPYRVDVEYQASAKQAEIKPMLEKLELTKGRGRKWGMIVRRGKIKVDAKDFAIIAAAMGIVDLT